MKEFKSFFINFLTNEIILITNAFHMKRAKNMFEREGLKVFELIVDFKSKYLKPKLIFNIICVFQNANNLYHSSIALR